MVYLFHVSIGPARGFSRTKSGVAQVLGLTLYPCNIYLLADAVRVDCADDTVARYTCISDVELKIGAVEVSRVFFTPTISVNEPIETGWGAARVVEVGFEVRAVEVLRCFFAITVLVNGAKRTISSDTFVPEVEHQVWAVVVLRYFVAITVLVDGAKRTISSDTIVPEVEHQVWAVEVLREFFTFTVGINEAI